MKFKSFRNFNHLSHLTGLISSRFTLCNLGLYLLRKWRNLRSYPFLMCLFICGICSNLGYLSNRNRCQLMSLLLSFCIFWMIHRNKFIVLILRLCQHHEHNAGLSKRIDLFVFRWNIMLFLVSLQLLLDKIMIPWFSIKLLNIFSKGYLNRFCSRQLWPRNFLFCYNFHKLALQVSDCKCK